ncbi:MULTISPECIES: Do family serine endopeptidase [Pseudothermotoga]|jgi:Do/DeqQ family serine protease|uniref:Protease Do n=2 Tax=Pseudothermotoga TaxID=1643951 RepID=A8F481_PSELT|nr:MULTISPECIES: Do family serine endopeptidase [Pseudothermotoga]ABV32965.1 protease Do [Pseudothermotoga lettingae TMO]MDK2883971.1 serine protease Do [Pseudothermotoga sp.]GLI48033.1 serine protease [Pseudothermotoga lettingae TMO]
MKKLFLVVLMLVASMVSFGYVNPDYQSPVVAVVEQCAPAVVKVEAVKYTTSPYFDPFMEEFFKRWFGYNPFGGTQESTSLGSGFIFDKEGLILTNEHVVDGSKDITITLLDGTTYKAEYVGGDEELDIAVLKIKPDRDLPVLEFGDSDSLKIGEWTIAIGNPLGFQHTVTIGVVSATGRRIPKPDGSGYYTNLIQTDAAINPGNSGGPLLNIHGQVIGINTAIINPTEAVNLGFAIPINTVKRFISQLVETGKTQKAYLGVRVMTVTENLAKAMGLKVNQGVLVVQVLENSPAERSGLKENDVIVKFDNVSVSTDAELVSLIHSHIPGDTVKLLVNRSGKEINLTVTLGSSAEEGVETAQAAQEFLGIVVDEITDSDRESYSLPASLDGVIVRQVKNSAQIQKGDVIYQIAVNGKNNTIKSVNDWNNIVSKIKQGDFVAIFVYRKGAKMIYSFTYR